MINILEHGTKSKFVTICTECGCKFEYDFEDTELDTTQCLTSYPAQYRRFVRCPECGHHLFHGYERDETLHKTPHIIYCCDEETCGIYKNMQAGKIEVNDACSFCNKNKFRGTAKE